MKFTEKQWYYIGGAALIILALYVYWADVKKMFQKGKYNAIGVDPAGIDRAKLLGIGDKGPEVAYLQRLIQQDGGDLGKFGVDGDFGPVTLAALQAVKGVDEISIAEYEGQPVRETRQYYRT